MKPSRTKIFIAISSLALVILLTIQVNWIFKTAKIKEELFNEKASMVLARTTEALRNDKEACKNLELGLGEKELHTIDSLFKHFMRFYNFQINYSFEVITSPEVKSTLLSQRNTGGFKINFFPKEQGCYQKTLEQVANNNGMDLKLIFPGKRDYIIEEMGLQFVTSVALIIVVFFMFWQTILSLIKEKRISEYTSDFLNNMTHEFKTPLTNIGLASNMIVKSPDFKVSDKIKYYLGIIRDENEKLRLQVEQVLSITALERGEIPARKSELDFHNLIYDSLKCMALQIEIKKGDVSLNLNASKFVIMGDKTHLTNMMCNLIDNAIKYAKQKPEILIQTYNDAENLIVVVVDQGIGIEKQFQKKVFHKFFRVPTGDVHDVKGFGLGLAYIEKIVELHKGQISLKSEKGLGTTFTIIFPNA